MFVKSFSVEFVEILRIIKLRCETIVAKEINFLVDLFIQTVDGSFIKYLSPYERYGVAVMSVETEATSRNDYKVTDGGSVMGPGFMTMSRNCDLKKQGVFLGEVTVAEDNEDLPFRWWTHASQRDVEEEDGGVQWSYAATREEACELAIKSCIEATVGNLNIIPKADVISTNELSIAVRTGMAIRDLNEVIAYVPMAPHERTYFKGVVTFLEAFSPDHDKWDWMEEQVPPFAAS